MSWLSRLKAARGDAQALSAQAEKTLRTWHSLPDAVLDRLSRDRHHIKLRGESLRRREASFNDL